MGIVALDDLARNVAGRSRFVAIDGPSGSGKSTFAARLAKRLPGCGVIPLDDFNSWSDPIGLTWWSRFEAEVLHPALAGQSLRYQRRDWETDEFGSSLASWRDVAESQFVMLEGVSSGRSSVRQLGAVVIWIEAPTEIRLQRGLARDGKDLRELWESWMRAEQEFFDRDGTKSAADFRISGAPALHHDPEEQVVLPY